MIDLIHSVQQRIKKMENQFQLIMQQKILYAGICQQMLFMLVCIVKQMYYI